MRVIERDGLPWFVAADVCRVLDIRNVPDAMGRLDEDEKSTIAITDCGNLNTIRNIINDSGLYSLVLTSRKPEARRFKKWVTSEVLPAIRKSGGYSTQAPVNLHDPNTLRTSQTELLTSY